MLGIAAVRLRACKRCVKCPCKHSRKWSDWLSYTNSQPYEASSHSSRLVQKATHLSNDHATPSRHAQDASGYVQACCTTQSTQISRSSHSLQALCGSAVHCELGLRSIWLCRRVGASDWACSSHALLAMQNRVHVHTTAQLKNARCIRRTVPQKCQAGRQASTTRL